jgi:hypothetical protein
VGDYDRVCREWIETGKGLGGHPCGRTARFRDLSQGRWVCGTHARVLRRWGRTIEEWRPPA